MNIVILDLSNIRKITLWFYSFNHGVKNAVCIAGCWSWSLVAPFHNHIVIVCYTILQDEMLPNSLYTHFSFVHQIAHINKEWLAMQWEPDHEIPNYLTQERDPLCCRWSSFMGDRRRGPAYPVTHGNHRNSVGGACGLPFTWLAAGRCSEVAYAEVEGLCADLQRNPMLN